MITICQLYSDIMSTYGDKGNTEYVAYFLAEHGIPVEVFYHRYGELVPRATIYMFGGGQDSAQILVANDLQRENGERLRNFLEDSYCLAVCGGYQLLGRYYIPTDGRIIDGLSYLPITTVAGKERFTGHVVGLRKFGSRNRTVVGFENHSGRTQILDDSEPLLRVVKGNGNNGNDRGEGIVYGKTIGTYLHGPVLPRNPHLVYWWLKDILTADTATNRPNISAEKAAHESMVAKT
jgi:CobQ-like glutamine amidotransferase family enzyme